MPDTVNKIIWYIVYQGLGETCWLSFLSEEDLAPRRLSA